jgi:hypothetical protein
MKVVEKFDPESLWVREYDKIQQFIDTMRAYYTPTNEV